MACCTRRLLSAPVSSPLTTYSTMVPSRKAMTPVPETMRMMVKTRPRSSSGRTSPKPTVAMVVTVM